MKPSNYSLIENKVSTIHVHTEWTDYKCSTPQGRWDLNFKSHLYIQVCSNPLFGKSNHRIKDL